MTSTIQLRGITWSNHVRGHNQMLITYKGAGTFESLCQTTIDVGANNISGQPKMVKFIPHNQFCMGFILYYILANFNLSIMS